MAPGWARRNLPSLALAHAAAVVLVSHCHYFVAPPTRQKWFWYELAVAAVLWLPARWYLGRVVVPTFRGLPGRERWLFAGLPAGLGLLVARWWAGAFEDTLWLHKPGLRAVLEVVLALSQAAVLAAGYAGLLAVTVGVAAFTPRSGETSGLPADGRRPSRYLVPLVGFLLFLAAANAFAAWYVRRERTLYYWDYMVYWTRSAELAELYRSASPGAVWDHFRTAARTDDYGPIPAALPAAAVALFGDTRLAYVLAVVNLYLAGFAAAAWLFVRRLAPSGGALTVVLPLLLTLLANVAWGPLLRGYLDVGGAALATLALLAYLARPAGDLRWTDVVLVAGLLAAMALFRRWYSFFLVAFVLVAGVDTTLAALRGLAAGGWREAVRRAAPFALVGAWVGVLLVSFAAGWVYRAATTDYADLYAAYKTPKTTGERAWEVVANVGPGTVGVAAGSFLVLLAYRDLRRVALVVGVMAPLMLLHFLRTQNPGPHHYNLFLPALVLLPALAGCRVLGPAPGWVRWPGVAALGGWGVVSMTVTASPDARPLYERVYPAGPELHYPPLTRPDLPEYVELLRATDRAAGPDGRVAVAATSLAINPTQFICADRSLGERLIDGRRVFLTPEVDRTGGFPVGYFQADVVVVAAPPQWHLRPEEHQGVIVTAESLLSGRDVGAAFDRLPGRFVLTDPIRHEPVEVFVYRRARPIPPADFEAYRGRLRQAHPGRPGFFTPPPGTERYLAFPPPR